MLRSEIVTVQVSLLHTIYPVRVRPILAGDTVWTSLGVGAYGAQTLEDEGGAMLFEIGRGCFRPHYRTSFVPEPSNRSIRGKRQRGPFLSGRAPRPRFLVLQNMDRNERQTGIVGCPALRTPCARFAGPSARLAKSPYKTCLGMAGPFIIWRGDNGMSAPTRRASWIRLWSDCPGLQSRHELQGSVVVHLPTPGGLLPVKLVFIRDRRGHSREWLALLCTEIRLPDDEVVGLYGKRWDIETLFKVSQSFLGLAREFQSRSYDAWIAHTTLVCWRYLFLTEETRAEQDLRSIALALQWRRLRRQVVAAGPTATGGCPGGGIARDQRITRVASGHILCRVRLEAANW